ncbi:MAG: hypothetical protein ABIG61_12240 [Planctomycetota bacterium]
MTSYNVNHKALVSAWTVIICICISAVLATYLIASSFLSRGRVISEQNLDAAPCVIPEGPACSVSPPTQVGPSDITLEPAHRKPEKITGITITTDETLDYWTILVTEDGVVEFYLPNTPTITLNGHDLIATHEAVGEPSISLFEAIAMVESGGDNWAIGDGGKSRGRYQISRAFWTDGVHQIIDETRDNGKAWVLNWLALDYDKFVDDPNSCQVIMKAYWRKYNATTNEERCRILNGGPNGMQKESTKAYWLKIQKYMDQNKGK